MKRSNVSVAELTGPAARAGAWIWLVVVDRVWALADTIKRIDHLAKGVELTHHRAPVRARIAGGPPEVERAIARRCQACAVAIIGTILYKPKRKCVK